MSRPTLLQAGATAALAGALALSGCSSETTRDATASAPEQGPLTAMLDAATGEFDPGASAQEDVEIENLIAECMSAEGFDYTPKASPEAVIFTAEDYEDAGTEEWVALHGYGIYKAMQAVDHAADSEAEAEPEDPNASYVASLSESEAGYPGLTTPESAHESASEAWDALYHWDDPSFTKPSDEDIAEFRDLEIAIATTDLACQQEVGWDTAMQEVQAALEETFLKDNKAAVDEYVAALESARR